MIPSAVGTPGMKSPETEKAGKNGSRKVQGTEERKD
jgi:hypothetical protein